MHAPIRYRGRARPRGALAVAAALAAVAFAPGLAAAQEEEPREREAPPEARADSLEARIAHLEALVDSLLGALETDAGADAPDAPGEAGGQEEDELAALREAARRAAGEGAGEAPADDEPQGSRTRSLQALNPEISITGDIVSHFTGDPEGPDRVAAVPREFEFSFQAALDPYTRTKIFVTRHEDIEVAGLEEVVGHGHEEEPGGEEPGGEEEHAEEEGHGGFEIEEGYMYWVGLPGGLGLKAGKFRQEIGHYNRWHTHALFEVDRPLAPLAFLGEEGLTQTGLSLTLPSFDLGPATTTTWLEVTRASNPLFEGGTDLSYLGRLQGFFDLGPSSYLQLGLNGVYGENDDEGLVSRLGSLDVAYRWSPAGRSLYRDLTLRGAWFRAERDFPLETETGHGGYLQANYRLDRRWVAGLRADYLDGFGDAPEVVQLVPSLSWWQSEWVRLRLQYNHLKPEGESAGHTLLLQAVWAVGPHKHETY